MKQIVESFILLVLLSVTFLSCENSKDIENNNLPPVKPVVKEFDVNNDLIIDFKIQYYAMTWDGIGPNGTGDLIGGEIVPLNNSKILKKQDLGVLFNPLRDTTYIQMNAPYSWESISYKLIEIKTNNNKWPKEWTVSANEVKDYYYLAFMTSTNSKIQLGWIKLQFDKSTGLVEIIETKSSDLDSLIIGKP
jgi:hypothetical protein